MFLSKEQPNYKDGKLAIPHENSMTTCSLVFWAEVGSLCEIILNRENPTEIKLTFRAKKTINMQLVDHPSIK